MRARQIISIALAMVFAIKVSAQDRLTYLDWNVLSQDSVCPVYSEVVPLESDYRHNTYRISLEYPTWEPLNAKEKALAEKHAKEIGETVAIDHYISVNRGEGLLNYSFVPIIRRDGKLQKLVSAKVVISPLPKPHTSRSSVRKQERYAANSVLATGTWKKIHITEDGIYRLTPSFLAGMGFHDPSKVHLYGYGGHQQPDVLDADNDFDDLEEVPLYKTANGDLLFWGNGLLYWDGVNRVFNAYANKATYFLTEGETRQDIGTEASYEGTVKQTVSTTLGHALHERDDYAWFRGGRNLVESTLFSGAYSKNYTLSGIKSLGNEKLTVVFTGNDVATPLTIWANGATVTTRTDRKSVV